MKRRLTLKQALWLERRKLTGPYIRRIRRRGKDLFRYPSGKKER